jgi:hypothetical protein
MRFFIGSVKPNPHILWCRSCNEVRIGVAGKCCGQKMWDIHKPDALRLFAEEACNPGSSPAALLNLARPYVGEAAAAEAAAEALAERSAMIQRREGKVSCKSGTHRLSGDGRCDYCGELVCTHPDCGNLARDEGLCRRHYLEKRAS